MSTYLPKEVQAGLDRARTQALKSGSRLRVVAGDSLYPVLRMWKSGFSIEAEDAPTLRGYIDLYDGSVHLFQCLVIASEKEAGEMRYEFKRLTRATDKVPTDFVRAANAPVALLTGKD